MQIGREKISTAFGKSIKLRRIELDLTQEELADIAQMARSFVSGVERGEKQATVLSVYRLAVALQTTPSDLWKKTEQLLGTN